MINAVTETQCYQLGKGSQGRLKIVQVASSLDDEAAGPSYSVPRLCEALAASGHSITLASTTSKSMSDISKERGFERCRYSLRYASVPVLGKLGIAPALRAHLFSRATEVDVFHTHGLWRFANVYPAAAARRAGKPFVLTPRGMLAPSALKFSALSKQIFWIAQQRAALEGVSAFHATSKQEYADIRAYGLGQPVAIIPNGIDLPTFEPASAPNLETPTVLFLGRLHPVKAIDRLIRAWHLLGETQKNWQLVITGPVEADYDKELKQLIMDLKLTNVSLQGPVRGAEKWRLLQSAELTVLPSLSENFGVAVAESLAAGTPVIASRGTPWEDLETNVCGWWVDNHPESLAKTLAEAFQLSQKARAAMGERGRSWMKRDFGWDAIAAKMCGVYSWLLGQQERPEWVLT